ncbi:MAG: hypothetical protein QNJ72_39405 [Pleurocapsa sp. MO_226.B13]|nr:hypothetical protein [Pleurocapsa sp. MO_226.B13]
MADLTLAQRFGSNVSFNQTAKTLTISLADLSDAGDLTNGLGLDTSGMTTSNQDEYSSKILYSLLQLSLQNQATDNNDETVGVYVTNEGRRNVTRNSFLQLGFRLVATAYQNDPLGVTLDPDNIGS